MGCASSTPMVATAGSEMLKAATHVAGDAKQKGEAAVEEATQALGATLDTAKESVSNAVAGITNELGNAFKDGTEALDEAKHKVMEGLHLESKAEKQVTDPVSTSRAPTPALDADADSLKTSTPEPEIERALANSSANEEEAPPTPKPSLQEMAELSAQVAAAPAEPTAAAAAAEVTPTTTEAAAPETLTVAIAKPEDSLWPRREELEEELPPRPSTTEWEKFADQLAKSRKFKPYESFAHSQNYLSVYKDYTSMRDKPGHYDGHFSEGNSLSSTLSDLSSGHLTPAPPRRRHGHRDYAKFVGSEQPGSVSRASSRLSNGGPARTFDFNPQRDRISLPIASTSSRVGSRVDSAAHNGRRSLWARGQPDVLHEEPHVYSPVPLRRSSMTTGLATGMGAGTGALRAVRGERGLLAARSTSSLATSPLPARIDAKKAREPTRSTSNLATSPRPMGVDTKTNGNQSRRTSEPFKDMHSLRSEDTTLSLSSKGIKVASPSPRFASSSKKEDKMELSSAFKSLLLDSARNIGTTVMLATPTMGTHSPTKGHVHVEPQCTSKMSKSPTPLASRSSTFIADASEGRRSSSKLATPTEIPAGLNARRSPASSRASPTDREFSRMSQRERNHSRASQRQADASRVSQGERDPSRASQRERDGSRTSQRERLSSRASQRQGDPSRASLSERDPSRASQRESVPSRDSLEAGDPLMPSVYHSSKTTTPLRVASVHRTPSKMIPHTQDSTTTSNRQPTGASRASRASSRLSSGSSEEIVIKPLSHLNTPSAVSLSPDQVVLTEYEDVDLEAALARLADWRGSTTTLNSIHSHSSHRLGRTSHTSSLGLGSRRTSPWVRNHTEHTPVPRSGYVDHSTPTKLPEQLDRCEICCTEIVMK